MNIFDINVFNTFKNIEHKAIINRTHEYDVLELFETIRGDISVNFDQVFRTIGQEWDLDLRRRQYQGARNGSTVNLIPVTSFISKFPAVLKTVPTLKTKYI